LLHLDSMRQTPTAAVDPKQPVSSLTAERLESANSRLCG